MLTGSPVFSPGTGRFRVKLCRLLATLTLANALGCQQRDATKSGERETKATPPAATQSTPAAKANPAREIWDLYYVRGLKTGYAHTRQKQVVNNGRPLVEIEVYNKLQLRRFGEESSQEVLMTSTETGTGELLDFRSETRTGKSPLIVSGRVEGDQLVIESNTSGKDTRSTQPWSRETGGLLAVERSLLAKPMQPGEMRELRLLMPMFNDAFVVTNRLKATSYETTKMLTGSYELLRIESQVVLPGGQSLDSTIWTDRNGDSLKSRIAAIDMETYRGTQEAALEQSAAADFDLGYDTLVPLDRPIQHPHQAQRIRYRVTLAHDDPAAIFVNGPAQTVKSAGPRVAEITVRAIRIAADGTVVVPADTAADVPSADGDLKPNGMIQSDDPRVKQLAAEAVGSQRDPALQALALERFVHDRIRDKNFSQALATAAEVAVSLEGDCTEHAFLLAALARATGIPARVAIGLVYVESQGGFGYHMWDELFLKEHWVPLDSTLGRGGIGAGHLKIAQSNLSDTGALACFLPVAKVLGQTQIAVLEVIDDAQHE